MRRSVSRILVSCLVLVLGCSSEPGAAPGAGSGGGGTGSVSGSSGGGGAPASGGSAGAAGVAAGGSLATAGTGAGEGGAGAANGGSGGGAGTAGTGGGAGTSSVPHDPETDGFIHPGILVNQGMLDFVKGKLGEDAEPWKSALAKAASSSYGSLSYTSDAHETVECGPFSNPDVGCSDEKNDVQAAYTHALLWYHTGDDAHAQKAIEILNDYAYTIKNHTNSNAPLQSAWVMETFPRAAEIIRYTYDGWAEGDIEQFEKMLREVYLPLIVEGSSSNGNWETSMIEGTMNIGVFTDDYETFAKAVEMWRERVPAYLYLESDGATPVPPPRGNKTGDALIGFWYGQTTFVNGLAQETCRDMSHTQYGLAGIINAAETARIQGIDLYAEEETRIRAALGFHAKYINGEAVPDWLCGGTIDDIYPAPMWEIVYNHYVNRLGRSAPQTQSLVMANRPSGADHHMAWETLTHGDIGNAGL